MSTTNSKSGSNRSVLINLKMFCLIAVLGLLGCGGGGGGGANTDAAPTAGITSPANGSSHAEGNSITFSGSASDAEDGDLSSSLSWSSDIDGAIGTGASFTSTALSLGTHVITASVTDSGGLSPTTLPSVTVTIRMLATLNLLSGSHIQTTTPMVVESTCNNCDSSATQYSWTIEGVANPVSTDDNYLLDSDYLLRQISISATPYNTSGESGATESVTYGLNHVETIVGNEKAFAAIKTDGTVQTWGSSYWGGDSSSVASSLTGVESIAATASAFAAIKSDGTVVTWGDSEYGGDSSSVASDLSVGGDVLIHSTLE
ncbi:MAG: hypothetical protein GY753_08830 [Gammaproteobacteria bacterium]|nr:hypothetical protein [Gammaproteobacteria bacterium]